LLFHAVVVEPRVPISTYRLQLNKQFTFRDARAVVGYLHALGISDAYASSYLAAVPGSLHGYDVADPTRLNPEVGTGEDYDAWIADLHAHGMGHLLDVVPNHMGIAKSANPWWLDVLENGPSSRYARYFDIDWHPIKTELTDRILIPILGDQYGAVLERGELALDFDAGAFVVRYYDDVLPIAPDTYAGILAPRLDGWLEAHAGDADADELQSILTAASHLPPRTTRDADAIATRAREKEIVKRRLGALAEASGAVRALIDESLKIFTGNPEQPRSFDRLDGLLNEQSYRLAYWRVASEEINYRRFFDINQLAALRMEDPAVFDDVHRFALELVDRGAATGLRIDHVDGLYAPEEYLARLQRCASRPLYVVVEKILATGEPLPEWPVHGTTGYEFAAVVNGLFVDGRSERALTDLYHRIVHDPALTSFADLAYHSKKQVMHETMSGDINALGRQLNRFSERNRHFRDFTLYSLISTLKEIIASFPVYRTYVTPGEPVALRDRRYIEQAVQRAKRRASPTSMVFDFIERLLLKQTTVATREECEERARFIGKFQQTTSPVAAKGIEDTALYRYNRLLSLNEVGGDPARFGVAPEAVHAWMRERQQRWPAALSATATHDTKRGEDVRARLNVLSEIPGAWKAAVARWRAVNRRHKTMIGDRLAPDANEEYFLYQTLIGAWPFETGGAAMQKFRERILEYLRKALREAKVHTSWLSPDEEYERAVCRFAESILDGRRGSPFLHAFLPLQARVAEIGVYNSLSQVVIKIAAPGVPDFYQGAELWDLNLVDPDNRRPVDYTVRRAALDDIRAGDGDGDSSLARARLDARADGRVKLLVTARALAARTAARELFERGDYLPLPTRGARHDCVFAFARRFEDRVAIACVPRLVAMLAPDGSTPPIGRAVWGDTRIDLPRGTGAPLPCGYRDVLTGTRIDADDEGGARGLAAAAVFQHFPVALLVPAGPTGPTSPTRP
jgi:(1->4)-alpha-D-glucan 1-alpha-D-glucosylmutase